MACCALAGNAARAASCPSQPAAALSRAARGTGQIAATQGRTPHTFAPHRPPPPLHRARAPTLAAAASEQATMAQVLYKDTKFCRILQ